MTDHISIFYSKRDSDFVLKLAEDLQEAGFKIWIAAPLGGRQVERDHRDKSQSGRGSHHRGIAQLDDFGMGQARRIVSLCLGQKAATHPDRAGRIAIALAGRLPVDRFC